MAEWPSITDALFELVDGEEFAGATATAYLRLQPGFEDDLPAVLIYTSGGNQGQIDRQYDVYVTAYAPGQDAVRVCDAVATSLEGANVSTPYGLLDTIDISVTAHDIPYVDAEINQANAQLSVRVRPV